MSKKIINIKKTIFKKFILNNNITLEKILNPKNFIEDEGLASAYFPISKDGHLYTKEKPKEGMYDLLRDIYLNSKKILTFWELELLREIGQMSYTLVVDNGSRTLESGIIYGKEFQTLTVTNNTDEIIYEEIELIKIAYSYLFEIITETFPLMEEKR